MDDADDADGWARWVHVMNRTHGYGSMFNYITADEKAIVELGSAEEWCRTVAAEFGFSIGEPEINHEDPPDCYVAIEGCRVGIELVQFIEERHKQRASGSETPYSGRLFLDMQWSEQQFVSKLNDTIQRKSEKYTRRGVKVDVLLIQCAEPWLSSAQASEWLRSHQITRHPAFESAFLLFEYEPGRGVEHWPVLHLYGDLAGRKLTRRPTSLLAGEEEKS